MEICWITQAGVRTVPVDAVKEVLAGDDGFLWVDLDHSDESGMVLLSELINARPRDLEQCHTRSPVPKLYAYPDHHFSAINGLARGTNDRLYFQPLKSFMTTRLLFTVLGPTSTALSRETAHRDLAAVRRQLDDGDFLPRSSFELMITIRSEILHAHEDLVTAAAARIGQLEQSIMQRDPVGAEALLGDLFGLRHDLQTIRTNAAQTHELYVHLLEQLGNQDTLMRVDIRRLTELRQGFSLLKNTTDLEREYLQEVLDLFQTRVSTELNRFVRKITAWGTIGIAWTVITGTYGMNFEKMPELHWYYGYPAAVGLMLVVGVVLATMFRRQGWL